MAAPGDLLTLDKLILWVGEIPSDREEFAEDVITEASAVVREAAHHEDWTINTAPLVAKRIAFQVAKRTYTNPDGEVQYTLGPMGGRVLDREAMGLYLTEEEEAALNALWPAEDVPSSGGALWIQPIDASPPIPNGLIYLDDEAGSPLLYGDTTDPITTIALTPDA